jgi:hypothetical protein
VVLAGGPQALDEGDALADKAIQNAADRSSPRVEST